MFEPSCETEWGWLCDGADQTPSSCPAPFVLRDLAIGEPPSPPPPATPPATPPLPPLEPGASDGGGASTGALLHTLLGLVLGLALGGSGGFFFGARYALRKLQALSKVTAAEERGGLTKEPDEAAEMDVTL